MNSAAGSDTDAHVLDSELQQLGLPKEHAAALTKVYAENQEKIRTSLTSQSLKGKSLNHVLTFSGRSGLAILVF